VSDILYAAFMAMSEDGLQKMMNIADEVLTAFGQEISTVSRKPRSWWYSPKELIEQVAGVELRGQTLGACDSFKYGGSQLNDSASMHKVVTKRVRMMSAAYTKPCQPS
jgi:hypothetical protein